MRAAEDETDLQKKPQAAEKMFQELRKKNKTLPNEDTVTTVAGEPSPQHPV